MKSIEKTPKQEWELPQLITLTRSQPEESVLTSCKLTTSNTGRGPTTTVDQCRTSQSASWRSGCGTTACAGRGVT